MPGITDVSAGITTRQTDPDTAEVYDRGRLCGHVQFGTYDDDIAMGWSSFPIHGTRTAHGPSFTAAVSACAAGAAA